MNIGYWRIQIKLVPLLDVPSKAIYYVILNLRKIIASLRFISKNKKKRNMNGDIQKHSSCYIIHCYFSLGNNRWRQQTETVIKIYYLLQSAIFVDFSWCSFRKSCSTLWISNNRFSDEKHVFKMLIIFGRRHFASVWK